MRGLKLIYIFSVFCLLFAGAAPVVAQTQDIIEPPVNDTVPTIIISELQNNGEGSGTSNQEFIELYNYGEEIINLLDYKLFYVTSTGTESELYLFSEPLMFLPDTFIMGKLSTAPEDFMLDTEWDFTYSKGSSGMAASAGGLKLIDEKDDLIDELYWTSSGTSDNPAVVSLAGGMSAQRYYLDEVLLIDEQNDFRKEFLVDLPTPREFIYQITQSDPEPPDPEDEVVINIPEPINNPPIYLNELFIDPVSPQLDSVDEFVEIYNPNNQKLDISDYKIMAGNTTIYTHTMPKGSFINPKAYIVIKSSDSTLTLSNSGGQVFLIDNLDKQIDSVSYSDAKAGYSWAKSGSEWFWTTQVTPADINVIKAPIEAVKSVAKKTATTKKVATTKTTNTNFTKAPPIKINEIFPDPSSPQKDSADEFIELYNPYDYPINIADYTITSGATRIYKHKIKSPAVIPAKGFYTVTSADTSLSLPNSGGQVTLINNYDVQIDSVSYPESIPGSSWVLVDGTWQWTSSPTKNSANKLVGLVEGLNKNKEDSKNTTVAGAVVAGTDDTPLVAAPQPLPGWVLAVLGVAAVCYAAYEYRFEARNYYYKYRTIRSPR